MTPEEKAKELFNQFYRETESGLDYDDGRNRAKACVIICVDEILGAGPINPHPNGYYEKSFQMDAAMEYWQLVKTSITNL